MKLCNNSYFQFNENNYVVDYSTAINNMKIYSKKIGLFKDMLQHVMIFLTFWMTYLSIGEDSRRNKLPNRRWSMILRSIHGWHVMYQRAYMQDLEF